MKVTKLFILQKRFNVLNVIGTAYSALRPRDKLSYSHQEHTKVYKSYLVHILVPFRYIFLIWLKSIAVENISLTIYHTCCHRAWSNLWTLDWQTVVLKAELSGSANTVRNPAKFYVPSFPIPSVMRHKCLVTSVFSLCRQCLVKMILICMVMKIRTTHLLQRSHIKIVRIFVIYSLCVNLF